MIGIQLDRSGAPVVQQARARGLLVNCTHDTVLRLLPPFPLSSAEARQIIQILDQSMLISYGGSGAVDESRTGS